MRNGIRKARCEKPRFSDTRQIKIEKFFNKKERKEQFRARFQLNQKKFYITADSRKKLDALIDEIRTQEHRAKYELPTVKHSPELQELFDRHAPKIPKPHQRAIFKRVSGVLLNLLPVVIKTNELKKAHFQDYIDFRLSQLNKHTNQPINFDTINKELYSISSALNAAPLKSSKTV